ncbi:hypothetical protein PoB_004246400 [Plakobranchus ocellatus]|uniref:Uncharacterized protein n=1 Tax=Plakobranchus ocellatus TaxID=259542 RepID=A0AAV4BC67_9GAST|nr:hypothetical protein PoB_004246400 [Plakobranchus ocellatus]
MSRTAPRRKEELLDVLQDNFIQSTKKYVSNVKEAMRAEEPETMAEIFQSAVAFLSQDLPDPTCQASDSQTKIMSAVLQKRWKLSEKESMP